MLVHKRNPAISNAQSGSICSLTEANQNSTLHNTQGRRIGLAFKNNRLVWVGNENDLIVGRSLLLELFAWVPYLTVLYWVKATHTLTRSNRPSISFAPVSPGPWYLIAGAAAWGGVDVKPASYPTVHMIYFDDITKATQSDSIAADAINGFCLDITKSHVAAVFASVFGYPLTLDPTTSRGPIVEKPETNGVHAGRIINGPAVPKSGFVYQKLIDAADENNQCSDLRTPCIGGVPALVWRKRKSPSGRFDIHNESAHLLHVEDVFSPEELATIILFNAKMGLDCGGLDILRDQSDGRIYIVDVNKTDLGPLIALSWSDKMKSMKMLGAALRTWLIAREFLIAETDFI